MATISYVFAREVLDSRGYPTVECSLWLDSGHFVSSTAPGGTSVGQHEAREIRDKDTNRMNGLGVREAVRNVNELIGPQLLGQDPLNQEQLDQMLLELDGTTDRSKLGANAMIATSQAILKAGAAISNLPLYQYIQQKYQLTNQLFIPSCVYTMINGGAHGADNLDIQEFELIPASHIGFDVSLSMAVTLYQKLEEVLITKGATHSVGLVGGFTPNLFNNTDAFEILVESIKASPYTFAQDIFFGADIDANSLHEGGKYSLKDRSQPYGTSDLIDYYKSLRTIYHCFYLEDPFHDDDWKSWQKLTAEIGGTTLIVGDSLLSTNKARLTKAIEEKACNSILVKPNQVGTITETIEVIKQAQDAGWQIVVSHRSGESNDDLIADLAVGVGAQYVKFGPPSRGERVAKYNRLLQIFQDLAYNSQSSPQGTEPTNAQPATDQPTNTQPITDQTTPTQELVPASDPNQPAQQPT